MDGGAGADDAKAEDIALARACADGSPAAIERFTGAMRPVVARVAGRFGHDEDDAWQRVATHLLVAAGDRPARIGDYVGRGSLRAFVRVVAARVLVDAQSERGSKEDPLHERLLDVIAAPGADPEAALARSTVREACRRAIALAAEGLRARERNVIRYAYVEGLGVGRIAALYRVHRATVSRWLEDATSSLKSAFLTELARELGLGSREYLSVAQMVDSHLSLSLERCLGGSP